MANIVKQILAKPIQLTDQVIKAAEDAKAFKQECKDIKLKAEKLAALLRQAARAGSDLYERPAVRIINDTEQVLEKAFALVHKCRANGIVKRAFTIIPAAAFRKMGSQLENSIGDVSWLLRVSAPANETCDDYLGLPPIAANEPMLGLIWEQIALVSTGLDGERADAAASLVSFAGDNDRYGKLIVEEGGVGPLLKLLKEGNLEGQENAAKAIGLLGRDEESVEAMIQAGVCLVFAKVLKEGSMKVQAVVAWAVSELVAAHPACQDVFAQHNVVRLLASHLAFEIVQEHSKYAIVGKNHASPEDNDDDKEIIQSKIPHPMGKSANQMHNVVTSTMAMKTTTKHPAAQGIVGTNNGKSNNHNHAKENYQPHYHFNFSYSGASAKRRESEDPVTKANMKAMAARALWHLAKDNPSVCRSITESRALLCFAVLLEKGTEGVRYNSAMALMEITSVAEKVAELRRSAFKPNSLSCKQVMEQLLRIVENVDTGLLIPAIRTIGSLARTFRVTETRMIAPLVQLLDEREDEVSKEACIALTKFACTENYLHVDHSKAIISAGGAKHLVQLVYFGEQNVKPYALVLLCYIAQHVPDSKELAQNQALTVIEWAAKQASMANFETEEKLLEDAKSKLELYHSRGSRFY